MDKGEQWKPSWPACHLLGICSYLPLSVVCDVSYVRSSNLVFKQGRKADGAANAHAVNVTMKRKYRYDNRKESKCFWMHQASCWSCSSTAVLHIATEHFSRCFIRPWFVTWWSCWSYYLNPSHVTELRRQLFSPLRINYCFYSQSPLQVFLCRDPCSPIGARWCNLQVLRG